MYRRGQSPLLSTLCGFGRPNAGRRIVIPEGNRMPSRKGRGGPSVSHSESFLSSAAYVRFVRVWWPRSHGLPKLLEGPTQIQSEEKRVQGGTLEGRGGERDRETDGGTNRSRGLDGPRKKGKEAVDGRWRTHVEGRKRRHAPWT